MLETKRSLVNNIRSHNGHIIVPRNNFLHNMCSLLEIFLPFLLFIEYTLDVLLPVILCIFVFVLGNNLCKI